MLTYTNKKDYPVYDCCEYESGEICGIITSSFLDQAISEAVISQIKLTRLADQVLSSLTSEYEQAKEQAASYRREAKRLETEIENLRGNLAASTLSATQLTWIDRQIQSRLNQIEKLAELEKQPIGMVGKPTAQQVDIDLVRSFLDNLGEKWPTQPNGLKNAFLRLLLDKIILYPDPWTVRAKLFWRFGLEQELLIYRPQEPRQKWTEAEIEILRQNYSTAYREELQILLPGREWTAIKAKARLLKIPRLVRGKRQAPRYTKQEDEIVRQFYRGEIDREEAVSRLGKPIYSIWSRAKRLGLSWDDRQTIAWEWIDKGYDAEEEHSPRPLSRPRTSRLAAGHRWASPRDQIVSWLGCSLSYFNRTSPGSPGHRSGSV